MAQARSLKSTPNSHVDTTRLDASTNKSILTNAKSRCTATHIFFYGSVLSNWHVGVPFSGARALELLTAELNALDVAIPSEDALTSRLIRAHRFNCGEQWMMAVKAWLFENSEAEARTETLSTEDFEKLRRQVLVSRMPKGSMERELWEGSLCRILREKAPRRQKGLGRKVNGFDAKIWDKVGTAVVTVGCVVRAKADGDLKKVYLASQGKHFVEGSPSDLIWGVGIHWTEPAIEDPAAWLGENRLGLCHDEAAKRIRDVFGGSAGGPLS